MHIWKNDGSKVKMEKVSAVDLIAEEQTLPLEENLPLALLEEVPSEEKPVKKARSPKKSTKEE